MTGSYNVQEIAFNTQRTRGRKEHPKKRPVFIIPTLIPQTFVLRRINEILTINPPFYCFMNKDIFSAIPPIKIYKYIMYETYGHTTKLISDKVWRWSFVGLFIKDLVCTRSSKMRIISFNAESERRNCHVRRIWKWRLYPGGNVRIWLNLFPV